VSFKPSCYKTSKTPNNLRNAMDPNSVIQFFVVTTLLETLGRDMQSISQVQVENTRSNQQNRYVSLSLTSAEVHILSLKRGGVEAIKR